MLDLKNKVNAISQAFADQPGLKIQKTNIEAYKITDTTLKTYGIVVSTFFVLDKDVRKGFFEESVLLADVKSTIMLKMLFLTKSNININFQA